MIDWEAPKSMDSSVSLWRQVLVANEFDKLQTNRKTSLGLSLIFVTVFLARGTNVNKNIMETFTEQCGYFLLAWSIQRLWKFTIYERYLVEPKSQRFIDLCTLSNISILIMDELYHGFYLHCRSPYEFSDCGMGELCDQIENEGRGIVASRELPAPGTPDDCQTFEIYTSNEFQQTFREVRTRIGHVHGL